MLMATLPTAPSAPSGEDVFVIAEIGKNFMQTEEDQPLQTYIDNAKALIDAAADSGADAVKFQTHTVEDEQLDVHIVSPHFKGSDRYKWVTRNTEATPEEFWDAITDHCSAKGIPFFSTPMSRESARRLKKYDVPYWKVGSGDVLDFLMLGELCKDNKPIIISSGMVSYEELDLAVNFIRDNGCQPIIFYCVSKYPCPPEEFNLASIEKMKELYPDLVIGFSDHSIGHTASLGAVKLGAQIVEKHFSLSRDLWGSDHKVSMTPDEMETMVKAIRSGDYENADVSLFYGEKDQELDGAKNAFRPYFQKKFVAAKSLDEGRILEENDLYAMRPASETEGIESQQIAKVLGKTLAKPLKKYDPITDLTLV